MKKLLLLLALLTHVTHINAQAHATIEGGYFDKLDRTVDYQDNGLFMLVGLDYYYEMIGASLKYRNLGGKGQFYEGKLHWAIYNDDKFKVDMSGGTSYDYRTGIFRPLIGVGSFVRVHELAELYFGTDHRIGVEETWIINVSVGVRMELRGNRDRGKIRMF